MTQKNMVENLIGLTLYSNQKWYPQGTLTNKNITLTKADTLVGDTMIRINYEKASVTVKGKKLRIPKELKTDLLTIVRLKIAKTIKYAKFN